MTRRALRVLVVALLLASALGCGKYGPPKRRLLETPANPPSAAPASGSTSDPGAAPPGEACEDDAKKPGTSP